MSDLEALSALFDRYRQFYRQPPCLEAAKSFMRQRLLARDSIIFIAFVRDVAVAFVQLYPSFSSVAMRQVFILNDLFVMPAARKRGIGSALLEHAEVFAAEVGAVRLTLATENVNTRAQALYEKLGWQRNDTFIYYNKFL